ncbi:hypothetical protein KBC55_02600 [Patescibacteria group bacterium]|nr:hypothetical protein [Patescibacteria group bacterium]
MTKLVKKMKAAPTTMDGGAKGLVAAGALAATIGGIYLMSRSKKKSPVKKAQAWILRAKADVMEELHKLPEVTREAYVGIVQSVLKHYEKMKDISKDELADLKKDLEGQWKEALKNYKKK